MVIQKANLIKKSLQSKGPSSYFFPFVCLRPTTSSNFSCETSVLLSITYSQATNFLNFGCVHLRHFGDLYMRHKCLPGAADEDVRRACEEGPSAYADPFGSMPVTSTVSYTTLQSVRIRVWLVTGSEPNFHFRASSTLELGLSIWHLLKYQGNKTQDSSFFLHKPQNCGNFHPFNTPIIFREHFWGKKWPTCSPE